MVGPMSPWYDDHGILGSRKYHIAENVLAMMSSNAAKYSETGSISIEKVSYSAQVSFAEWRVGLCIVDLLLNVWNVSVCKT